MFISSTSRAYVEARDVSRGELIHIEYEVVRAQQVVRKKVQYNFEVEARTGTKSFLPHFAGPTPVQKSEGTNSLQS